MSMYIIDITDIASIIIAEKTIAAIHNLLQNEA